MKLNLSGDTFDEFPNLKIGVIVAKGIDNNKFVKLDEVEIPSLRDSRVKVWNEAYSELGVNPEKNKPSIVNLIGLAEKGIPKINSLVDIYNYVSLKYVVPVGGSDLDKISGDIYLRVTKGKQGFLPLNSKNFENVKAGEIVYFDNEKILTRRWNCKESDLAKFTSATKNAIIEIEALPPFGEDELRKALDELRVLIVENLGGEVEGFVLDKDNPALDVDSGKVLGEAVEYEENAVKAEKVVEKLGSVGEEIIGLISGALRVNESRVRSFIEVPPRLEMGDFAFPCFGLAKDLAKSPVEIAKDLVSKIKFDGRVEAVGPYVNFFVDRVEVCERVLGEEVGLNFGSGKKIGVEYPSPNTNKPLHVGHLRNMAIGGAVSNLLKEVGEDVVHLNLFNDRGILICKSMVGYEMYALGKSPESEGVKGDKFVGDLYVRFSKESKKNPELDRLAEEKLRLWEAGDEATVALWEKMNGWVYEGMRETFEGFGLGEFDAVYRESEIYKQGREIVEAGLEKGVFVKRDDGAIICDLEAEGLGEKVLLRKDGTSVYMTQDLVLAEKKISDFGLDSSYYVVGGDQKYHFQVLFKILEKLGYDKDWRHLSYGMVRLPEGKMSSREGTVIMADDLIAEAIDIARKRLEERGVCDEDKARVIALAAIKYSLLKVDMSRDIAFEVERALEFEGDTGPYLLYSYARASSLLKKVKRSKEKGLECKEVDDVEYKLVKKLGEFEGVVRKAYVELAPNLVANYCYELARDFNEFYHACPVLGGEKERFRLEVVGKFREVLGKGLDLLGIEKLEEM